MEITFITIAVMFLVFSVFHLDSRIRQIATLLTHYLKDTTRCPDCDHPAVGASFCEETPYTCPQCGEEFIWKLKNGRYFLATNIEGNSHE